MPLVPQIILREFDKWVFDFVGPITPMGKCTRVWYIITASDYLTRWEEHVPVRDCTIAIVVKFLFKNVVRWFGSPKILIINQGTHFVNKLIEELIDEF